MGPSPAPASFGERPALSKQCSVSKPDPSPNHRGGGLAPGNHSFGFLPLCFRYTPVGFSIIVLTFNFSSANPLAPTLFEVLVRHKRRGPCLAWLRSQGRDPRQPLGHTLMAGGTLSAPLPLVMTRWLTAQPTF